MPRPPVLSALLAVCALLLCGACSPDPAPVVPLATAHGRLEDLFGEASAAVRPPVQWTDPAYTGFPALSGLCGTQGCHRTGRAELQGVRWVRTRVSAARYSALLDQVARSWTEHGYPVERRAQEVVVRAAGHTARLWWLDAATGCVRLESSVADVEDTGGADGFETHPFGRGGDGGRSCASATDPYWSG
ncbi:MULTISPECIES: hypothetical protein [Kitasatospora]|uniref:Lipoprotein n=1 Tax=Kitasatospora cystarginea TaxID=58350 RepID=A0ABN3DU58_9ACTN